MCYLRKIKVKNFKVTTCVKFLPLNRRPLVIWTQFLHTKSDFYEIYMAGKLRPRATTSMLKVFPESGPNLVGSGSLSSRT